MRLLLTFVALCLLHTSTAQPYGANPLEVASKREWQKKVRPAVMEFFQQEVYGIVPPSQPEVDFHIIDEGEAFGGKVKRREVEMTIGGSTKALILIYLPAQHKGKVPVFLGMNFKGNHQIAADPEVTISDNAPRGKELGTDPERGAAASRWTVEMLTEAGYGVVTIYRGDIDPDFDDGFRNGIHPHFYAEGQTSPYAHEWGTIGAWAWSLSRVMDYLEKDNDIDHKHVAVIGHSRLGKTALWAGAQDSRFAMVISNDSGCGGAALSMRKHGETVAAINRNFPHWFCDNYNKYSNNEEELWIDQQGLLALIAPRPIYVASASLDDWADPEGEFLAALYASPIYELYGKKGLTSPTMPAVNTPVGDGHVGYHLREGKHDITAWDWAQYIKFADRHFFGR
ncbi:MAG: acetylxylan esterase [Alistipes sp.]|nr:acetylxylan esterase [Alistipes sp.]